MVLIPGDSTPVLRVVTPRPSPILTLQLISGGKDIAGVRTDLRGWVVAHHGDEGNREILPTATIHPGFFKRRSLIF